MSKDRVVWAVALAVLLVALAGGCANTPGGAGGPGGPGAAGGRLQVVAAENFWGSLAAQLGGDRVSVRSILTDPNADPHEYTSNPADARAIADARYVITNGAGYDTWASKMLAANPSGGRRVLDAATLTGTHTGENPHLWYQPAYVARVVDAIAADYRRIDPGHAAYYDGRHAAVVASLAPYRARIAALRARFAGVRIGSTESIFVYMASALGLDLVSPPEFMQAVAEGNDPPAPTVVTFGQQLSSHAVKALVYNLQTATAVTTNIKRQARAAGIPLVPVSESLQPPGATFQDWQDRQLDALTRALASAPGR